MMIIMIVGLINIEVALKVDGFPIVYSPVRYPFFGVNSSVSGVGQSGAFPVINRAGHGANDIGKGSYPRRICTRQFG